MAGAFELLLFAPRRLEKFMSPDFGDGRRLHGYADSRLCLGKLHLDRDRPGRGRSEGLDEHHVTRYAHEL